MFVLLGLVNLVRPHENRCRSFFVLAVVQPTSFCNIDCTYCYVDGREDQSKMGPVVIARVADFLDQSVPKSQPQEVLWHCGEPTVLGVGYYEEFCRIFSAKVPANRWEYSLQTNLLLVDDKWVDFFESWRVSVSASIDPPRRSANYGRTDRLRRSTRAKAVENFRVISKKGIRADVLGVISSDDLQAPEETLDSYLEVGAEWVGFNVDANLGFTEEEYGQVVAFWEVMYRHWKSAGMRIQVREFDFVHDFIARRNLGESSERPEETTLFEILTFDKDGEIYTYAPELATLNATKGKFNVGNVSRTLEVGDLRLPMAHDDIVSASARCQSDCDYFELCGSRFLLARYYNFRSFKHPTTPVCRAQVMALWDGVLAAMDAS